MEGSKEDDLRQVGWASTPSEGKSKDEEEDELLFREKGVRLILADPSQNVCKLCSRDVNVIVISTTKYLDWSEISITFD